MHGASVAESSAMKTMKNMLLRWKYCSDDDINPNTNPKRPSQPDPDQPSQCELIMK